MPDRIGHYKIVSKLGRGGMGVVYKAHEESLNRFVAIKVLGEHLVEDHVFLSRFVREAQSAASLSHPNIVPIYSIGEDQGTHYFVMEYVAGRPVDHLINQHGKLEPKLAARIVLDAANGLAAAHDQGVIHRDIKPANLMIDSRGIVKIADFGLALPSQTDAKLTATGMLMGTPGYLAPEQCKGEQADHRTDIYALGVTLYEMLTGRAPFQSESPILLIRQILDEEPPPVHELNPDADDEIRKILLRMTEKDRDARYQSAQELIEDLDSYLSGDNSRALQKTIAGMVTLPPEEIAPDTASQAAPTAVTSEGAAQTGPTVPEAAVPTAVIGTAASDAPPPPPPGSPDLDQTEVVAVTQPDVSQHRRGGSSSMIPLVLFVFLLLLAGGAAAWFMSRPEEPDPILLSENESPTVDLHDSASSDTALRTVLPPDTESARADAELDDISDPVIEEREPVSTGRDTESTARSEPTSRPAGSNTGPSPTGKSAPASSTPRRSETPAPQNLLGTAIVAFGDQQLGPDVSALLTEKLSRGEAPVYDGNTLPAMEPLIRSRAETRRLLEAASDAGVRNLLVVEITPTGERQLNYMGRTQTAYSSRVRMTAYDVRTGSPIATTSEPIEYTTLNREREAEKIVRRLVLAITKKLR